MTTHCSQCGKQIEWEGGIVARPPCPACGHTIPRAVLYAMSREMEGMEAISAHCRDYGTPRGSTLTLRSPETGTLLRVLIALRAETDPRPRPITIERQVDLRWEPWLDARWGRRRRIEDLRDCHGPDPRLTDDEEEDLRYVQRRLREGGVGDDE